MTQLDPTTPLLALAIDIGYVALGLALLCALIRLVRGPTLPDRVVALDLTGVLSIAVIALHVIDSRRLLYLDAAVALALVAFLGTVAFARFVEWNREGEIRDRTS